jgi:uncharacterized protein with PQ loop repeat
MATSGVINEFFLQILRVSSPFFFLCIQASILEETYHIVKAKSIGSKSVLPFLSLLSNCMIWAVYGAALPSNTILLPNLLGIVIGYFCSAIYYVYSPKGVSWMPMLMVVAVAIISLMLGLAGQQNVLGLMGILIGLVLLTSPLATLTTVLSKKSTESMPFPLCLMNWCNALSWFLYGILDTHDPIIYAPNALGFAIASFQLMLFAVFGFSSDGDYQSKQQKIILSDL